MAAASYKAMASAQIRARNSFIEMVTKTIGCSDDEGAAIFALYIKKKFMKTDAIIGSYHVKHGAFLDDDVLKAALEMTREAR